MDIKKVIGLVHEAGKLFFDEGLKNSVSEKGRHDYVTKADIAISDYLKAGLKKLYSYIAFVSEEDISPITDDYWLLDPIDGTANFVFGYNMSSISLARIKDGVVTAAVVYNPFSKETFTASLGKGARLNGQRIAASAREMENAVIEIGLGACHKEHADRYFSRARKVFDACHDLRRMASAALTLCYIACGRADGYFEQRLHPWDFAAGMLILTEAGGLVTDWQGKRPSLQTAGTIVAANSIIHNRLRQLIL